MPPVMLDFELNEDDKTKIRNLKKTLHEKYDKNSTKDNLDTLMRDYFEKIELIYSKAHERALKYYEIHQDKILCALKQEIKNYATFLGSLDNSLEKIDKAIDLLEIQEQKNSVIIEIAPYLEILKSNVPKDYEEIISFIDYAFEHRAEFFQEEREAIKDNKKKAIMPKISLPPTAALSLMFSGKQINALGLARGKGKFDPASRILKVGDANIFAPENTQKIGVGAAKAFRYILAEFTKHNSQNMPKDKIINRIFLNVKDFAEANGININSSDAMKNFRRKLKGNLNILLTHKISWSDKIKGKKEYFPEMTWISAFKPTGDLFMIEVTQSMAEILALLPMIYYSRTLYSLDDREFNAFAIGEAMCIHYCQENNVIKGTENKISVLKLLEKTSFPTYKELKEHKWSWEEKVKEPFENCLEKLYQCGFLKDRKYCYAGGIEITDEEVRAGVIDSYEKFISLLVKFELNEFNSHEKRLTEIVQKKDESIKKFQLKNKNKKKSDND